MSLTRFSTAGGPLPRARRRSGDERRQTTNIPGFATVEPVGLALTAGSTSLKSSVVLVTF